MSIPVTIKRLVSALLISGVWGYFADLRHGQYGWFAGRVVFTVALVFGVTSWLDSRKQKT